MKQNLIMKEMVMKPMNNLLKAKKKYFNNNKCLIVYVNHAL